MKNFLCGIIDWHQQTPIINLYNRDEADNDAVLDQKERGSSIIWDFQDSRWSIAIAGSLYPPNRKPQSDSYKLKAFDELLSLIQDNKPEKLSHLRGDFSAVICDKKESRFYICRDPVGIVPVWYSNLPDFLIFSSDINWIINRSIVPKDLNIHALILFLYGARLPCEDSYYAAVRRLPPGKVLVCDPNGIRTKTFYKIDTESEVRFAKDEDYVEAYRELLDKAVERRLFNGTKTASLLSGGLDSPSIATIAARKLSASEDRLTTYSFVLPENDPWSFRDERPLIQQLVNNLPVEPIFISQPSYTLLETLNKSYNGCTGHIIQNHPRLYMALEDASKRGIEVLFDGYGGDHIATISGSEALIEWIKGGNIRSLFRHASEIATIHNRSLVRAIYGLTRQILRNHISFSKQDAVKKRLKLIPWLNQEFLSEYPVADWLYANPSYKVTQQKSLRDSLILNFEDVHAQGGIEGMYLLGLPHSINIYFPLLDSDLIEYCMAVPPEQHLMGLNRRLIRRAMKDQLPDNIRLRNDKSFSKIPDSLCAIAQEAKEVGIYLRSIASHNKIQRILNIGALIDFFEIAIPRAYETGAISIPGLGGAVRGLILARFMQSYFSQKVSESSYLDSSKMYQLT